MVYGSNFRNKSKLGGTIIKKGCGAFELSEKLVHPKNRLHNWAKFSFGLIKQKKLALLHDLKTFCLVKESNRLTTDEMERELDLRFVKSIPSKSNEGTGICGVSPLFVYRLELWFELVC